MADLTLQNLDQFLDRIRRVPRVALLRVVERAEQLLADEVPVVTTNLRQGITSDVHATKLKATVTISARRGRQGVRTAEVVAPDGSRKSVKLRAQARFDYAEAVARGTGVYGPTGQPIRPKNAKVLIVPGTPGPNESYIEIDGKKFLFRRSVKGRKPNPYDQRAIARLMPEVPRITDRALEIVLSE